MQPRTPSSGAPLAQVLGAGRSSVATKESTRIRKSGEAQAWRETTTELPSSAENDAPTPALQSPLMRTWPQHLGLTRDSFITSARVTVAAVASMLLARSLKMPEFYWAPISTIVILLSTINPLTLAWQRFVGTALGALLGALVATYFHSNWIVYAVGIFACGILSSILGVGSAYRFAAIAFSIVLLIAHDRPPIVVATHRFIEVSLGIAVALIVTVIWRVPVGRVG